MKIKEFKDVEKKLYSLKINSFLKENLMIILSMGENILKTQFKEVKNLSHKVN